MVNKESKSGARVVPVQLRSRSSQQCPCPWRNRHRPRAKVIGACTVHLEHKRTRQRLLVGRPRSLPIATAKINRNALSEPRGEELPGAHSKAEIFDILYIYIYDRNMWWWLRIIYYYRLLSFIIIITLLYNACLIIIIMMLVLYMWETNAINLQSWRACATHFWRVIGDSCR